MRKERLLPRIRLTILLSGAFGVAGGAYGASTATAYLAPPPGFATLLASGSGSLNNGALDIDAVSERLLTLDSIGSPVSSLRQTGVAAAGGSYTMTAVSDWWSLLEGLNGNRNVSGGMNSASSVSAVPLPTAIWLFGSALLGFVALVRRRI